MPRAGADAAAIVGPGAKTLTRRGEGVTMNARPNETRSNISNSDDR